MKYLAILVLLLAPAMAQEAKDKYNLDALYGDVCTQFSTLDAPEKLDAYVATIPLADIAGAEKNAILCSGSPLAAKSRRIATAFVLQVERRMRDIAIDAAIDQMAKRRDADLSQAYQKFGNVKQASESYIALLKDHLQSCRSDVADNRQAQPPVVYQQPAMNFEQPRPLHCVASGAPLGTSTITSVNCY